MCNNSVKYNDKLLNKGLVIIYYKNETNLNI